MKPGLGEKATEIWLLYSRAEKESGVSETAPISKNNNMDALEPSWV
jgi:hypothetical protein